VVQGSRELDRPALSCLTPPDEAPRPSMQMAASGRAGGAQPLRFMQKQKIMLDHFGSGISNNRTCKWGIEWDICASTYLKEEYHLEASF
jgi:hypothetical protein